LSHSSISAQRQSLGQREVRTSRSGMGIVFCGVIPGIVAIETQFRGVMEGMDSVLCSSPGKKERVRAEEVGKQLLETALAKAERRVRVVFPTMPSARSPVISWKVRMLRSVFLP